MVVSWFGLLTVGVLVAVLNINPGDTGTDRSHLENLLTVALCATPTAVLIVVAIVRHRRREVEAVAAQLASGRPSDGVQFAVGMPRRWVEPDGRPSIQESDAKALVLEDDTGPLVRWGGINMPGADLDLHPAIWLAEQ